MAEIETVVVPFSACDEHDLIRQIDRFGDLWNMKTIMQLRGVRNITVTWNEPDNLSVIVIFYGRTPWFSRAKYKLKVRLGKLRDWLEKFKKRL